MFSVIFDMDGTLLDTQRIGIPAWEYAGRQQGFKGMGKHVPELCGMNANGSNEFLRINYPAIDAVLFKKQVKEYINKYGVVKFKEGAKELLDFLKAKNVKIALATGTSRPSVEHHIKEVNSEHYFLAMVCGNEVQNGKPAPDVFLEAARQIGESPENCFVFEDSENGIKAAVQAGMKAIGIPDIAPFNDETKKMLFAEINTLDEAIAIFEKIL